MVVILAVLILLGTLYVFFCLLSLNFHVYDQVTTRNVRRNAFPNKHPGHQPSLPLAVDVLHAEVSITSKSNLVLSRIIHSDSL
jgi:hypothetical protein